MVHLGLKSLRGAFFCDFKRVVIYIGFVRVIWFIIVVGMDEVIGFN